MSSSTPSLKDPWRPLGRGVVVLGVLIAGFILVTVVLPLLQGQHDLAKTPFAALSGHPEVCMKPPGIGRYGVEFYCDGRPGPFERLAVYAADAELGWVFLTGALVLLWRILRGEARQGTFSAETVGRFRVLGWYLIVGEAVVSVFAAVVHRFFLDKMIPENVSVASVRGWLDVWDPSWLVVLAGLALIAFARVMRVGAAMRQDLEATI